MDVLGRSDRARHLLTAAAVWQRCGRIDTLLAFLERGVWPCPRQDSAASAAPEFNPHEAAAGSTGASALEACVSFRLGIASFQSWYASPWNWVAPRAQRRLSGYLVILARVFVPRLAAVASAALSTTTALAPSGTPLNLHEIVGPLLAVLGYLLGDAAVTTATSVWPEDTDEQHRPDLQEAFDGSSVSRPETSSTRKRPRELQQQQQIDRQHDDRGGMETSKSTSRIEEVESEVEGGTLLAPPTAGAPQRSRQGRGCLIRLLPPFASGTSATVVVRLVAPLTRAVASEELNTYFGRFGFLSSTKLSTEERVSRMHHPNRSPGVHTDTGEDEPPPALHEYAPPSIRRLHQTLLQRQRRKGRTATAGRSAAATLPGEQDRHSDGEFDATEVRYHAHTFLVRLDSAANARRAVLQLRDKVIELVLFAEPPPPGYDDEAEETATAPGDDASRVTASGDLLVPNQPLADAMSHPLGPRASSIASEAPDRWRLAPPAPYDRATVDSRLLPSAGDMILAADGADIFTIIDGASVFDATADGDEDAEGFDTDAGASDDEDEIDRRLAESDDLAAIAAAVPEVAIDRIPYWVSPDRLAAEATHFGDVRRIRYSVNDRNGVFLGCALVLMATREAAARLSEAMNGFVFAESSERAGNGDGGEDENVQLARQLFAASAGGGGGLDFASMMGHRTDGTSHGGGGGDAANVAAGRIVPCIAGVFDEHLNIVSLVDRSAAVRRHAELSLLVAARPAAHMALR